MPTASARRSWNCSHLQKVISRPPVSRPAMHRAPHAASQRLRCRAARQAARGLVFADATCACVNTGPQSGPAGHGRKERDQAGTWLAQNGPILGEMQGCKRLRFLILTVKTLSSVRVAKLKNSVK